MRDGDAAVDGEGDAGARGVGFDHVLAGWDTALKRDEEDEGHGEGSIEGCADEDGFALPREAEEAEIVDCERELERDCASHIERLFGRHQLRRCQ